MLFNINSVDEQLIIFTPQYANKASCYYENASVLWEMVICAKTRMELVDVLMASIFVLKKQE